MLNRKGYIMRHKPVELMSKVQKNYNITLPKTVRTIFHLHMGDFISISITSGGILLKPKKLIDSSQAYFWTREWQKEERRAEKDIRSRKISNSKNARELLRQLKK